MQIDVQFASDEQTPDGLPVYRPGDRVAGQLILTPDQSRTTRGVQLWIGCRIHGSGTPETLDLQPEQFCYQGSLTQGVPVTASFNVPLPESSPLSYQGRRIKFEWEVRLRVDIPILPDTRLAFPFLVLPRRIVR